MASIQRDLVVAARDGDLDAYSPLVRAALLVLPWKHVRSLCDPDARDAWIRRLTVRSCYKVAHKEKRRTQEGPRRPR